jgi:hypothetical protein
MGMFVQSLARADLDLAGTWVKDLPPGRARQKAIQSLLAMQAGQKPDQRDSLIEAWTSAPDRDAALGGATSNLQYTDPPKAIDFARRISDPSYRESAVEGVARAWLFRDETAARTWIASSPDLTSEQRRVLLRQVDGR